MITLPEEKKEIYSHGARGIKFEGRKRRSFFVIAIPGRRVFCLWRTQSTVGSRAENKIHHLKRISKGISWPNGEGGGFREFIPGQGKEVGTGKSRKGEILPAAVRSQKGRHYILMDKKKRDA